MFSFLFSPIDVDGKDGGRDERAPSPTPLLEDGHASGPNSSSSSSSSSKVVLRSAAAMFTIADSETRTEASVAGREGKEDSGPVRKGKEPLLESVLNELNGDGKGLSALSPHRLMQVAKTIVLCCAYMAIGPSLILLNKHILKDLDNGRGFNYPMFLSCLGLISSSLTSHALVRLFGCRLENQDKMDWKFYMRNVVPVGACQALTLALGNAAYLYLTVSFIQMLKAFTPVVVLAIGILFKIEKAEPKIIMSVLGICAGTALASYGEINFSMIGILTMFAAEVTEAVRLILVQYLLQNLKFSIVESQYYLAPCAAMALLSASLLLELPSMRRHDAFAQIAAHPFLFLAAGTLGVGVHFLSFLVVQVTNSVTLKVLGTARNALLVVASVYLFAEVVSPIQFLGYSFSLGAFAAYSYLKAKRL